jgi:hypothetical protein
MAGTASQFDLSGFLTDLFTTAPVEMAAFIEQTIERVVARVPTPQPVFTFRRQVVIWQIETLIWMAPIRLCIDQLLFDWDNAQGKGPAPSATEYATNLISDSQTAFVQSKTIRASLVRLLSAVPSADFDERTLKALTARQELESFERYKKRRKLPQRHPSRRFVRVHTGCVYLREIGVSSVSR